MDTLIKLLNEYEEDKIKGTKGLSVMFIWKYEGVLHYYNNYKDENVFDNVRYLIISKEYGFIEWLVREDKIDLLKRTFMNLRYAEEIIAGHFSLEEKIIIILAISENPISDLISYLK